MLAKSYFAGRIAGWRSRRIGALLRSSGQIGNSSVIATQVAARALGTLVGVSPVAVVASIFISPLFLGLLALPLIVAVAPEIRLKDQVAQRREGVERELPFFSVFASVLGSAGVPLYLVFRTIAESDVFAYMRREARLMRRDVEIFGMNPNDSLERVASSHPSGRFSDFLLGYTSKARSGGDVTAYLSNEGGALLKDLEGDWARYTSRVGIIGSMMITVFGVVPLMLMVVGVFSPVASVTGLLYFTGVGVPLFTVGLLFMAGRMQPAQEAHPRGKLARSLALALAGVGVELITWILWLSVATALLLFFLGYWLSARGALAEARDEEAGLARFLKDLLEYKRQEYDLAKAVVAIQSTTRYNRRFDYVLLKVANQLRAGVPLDRVKAEFRCRLGRLVFVLLGEMSRSGGGTVDTVFQISSFADRIGEMRRNTRSEMKPYLYLSYVSPLLLAFGVTFVGSVLSSLGSRAGSGLSALHIAGAQMGTAAPALSQVSDLLIVVSAASLGLIGAKLTDFTVRNTLKPTVNVLLAVLGIATMASLGSHSLASILVR
jgi:flagellar protein FlaJ